MNSFVRVPAIPARRTALATALCALALMGAAQQAGAATVGACTGVSLPPNAITDTLAPTLLSAGGLLDGLLLGLGLTGNIQNELAQAAAGQPISLNVLDINGNQVDVLNDPYCVSTADEFKIAPASIKGVSIGGNSITGLGDEGRPASAGEIDSIAFGNDATTDATSVGAIAIGTLSSVGANSSGGIALGTNSAVGDNAPGAIAIGENAVASHANSVALGAGSLTTQANEVSIGSLGFERKLTNVAAGTVAQGSTDAVNGDQLDLAVQYDPTVDGGGVRLKNTITLAGAGGTTITNVADAVNPTDAVNLGQLNAGTVGLVQQVGGAPGNGDITVGAATGGTVINVSGTSGDRRITGVADAVGANDAVNLGQLSTILGDYVKYDNSSKTSITLGNPSVPGSTTQIKNVTDGTDPQDAVTVNQLTSGGNDPYFQANSTGTGASATGTDAVAIGQSSISSGQNAIAMGVGSQATNTGAIAIGQSSVSAGVNTIAIGTNAHAYASVAVGTNAEANGGGAAFGDNSFAGNLALAVDRGTAVGNGARAQADLGTALGTNAQVFDANSVALGADSRTRRGAQTNYTAAALSAPQTSVGEVSVGDVGAERQITNVAAGSAGTDAVNVDQLNAVQNTTNNTINNLTTNVYNIRDDLRGGVSQAMAMASLPQASLPGKRLVAAGASYYMGESALALGVSALSDNGQWILKGQATADSQGNGGVGVGVGRHW